MLPYSIGRDNVTDIGVTIVIPFGGYQRLPLLEKVLTHIVAFGNIDQIIVSEWGAKPEAHIIASQLDVDYIFSEGSGPFNKSRAINSGCDIARNEMIVWLDGDILFKKDFLNKGIIEASQYDFFYPFSKIDYIDEFHTFKVLNENFDPFKAPSVRSLGPLAGGAPGGIGIVRRAFLRRWGGMIEGFRGWGKEDCAWAHKATILGRVGWSANPTQRAVHLFHLDGGSQSNLAAIVARNDNPHFKCNAELSDQVHAIADPGEMHRLFPPPAYALTPWQSPLAFRILLSPSVGKSARHAAASFVRGMACTFGIQVEQWEPRSNGDSLGAKAADVTVAFIGDITEAHYLPWSKNGSTLIVWQSEGLIDRHIPPGSGNVLHLAPNRATLKRLRAGSFATWHRPWTNRTIFETAVQALSVLASRRSNSDNIA